MRKIGVLFVLLLLVMPLVLQVVKAQQELPEEIPLVPKSLQGNPDEIIDKAKNQTLSKWEYLSKEWKNMLRKNAVYAPIDKFFLDNNWFFKLFFGMNYDLSFVLVVAMIWWLFFAFWGGVSYRTFEEWMSARSIPRELSFIEKKILPFLSGIVIAAVLGNLQILWLLAKFIDQVVFFYPTFLGDIVSYIITIAIFVFLSKFFSKTNKSIRKSVALRKQALVEKGLSRQQKEIKQQREALKPAALRGAVEATKTPEEKDEEDLVRKLGEELNRPRGTGDFDTSGVDDKDINFDKP